MSTPSPNQTGMDALTDELLLEIFSLAGNCLKQHRFLCKRFYGLWRESTTQLDVEGRITKKKLRQLLRSCSKRFNHIQRLNVHPEQPKPGARKSFIPGFLVAHQLALCLPRLQHLSLNNDTTNTSHDISDLLLHLAQGASASSATLPRPARTSSDSGSMYTLHDDLTRISVSSSDDDSTDSDGGTYDGHITSSSPLNASADPQPLLQLQHLGLHDRRHQLTDEDVSLLASLRGLSSLHMAYSTLAAGAATLAAAAAQLASSLQHLQLHIHDAPPSPAQMRHWPGGLSHLTALTLRGVPRSGAALAHSLSRLTSLRRLHTDGPVVDPDVQKALTGLQQLTCLQLEVKGGCGDLSLLLQHLTGLKELTLRGASVSSDVAAPLFRHTSLCTLEVADITCDQQWQGQQLEDCAIEEIKCTFVRASSGQAAPFLHWPTFPRLRAFSAHISGSAPGHSWAGLGQFLARHSETLQELALHAVSPAVYDQPLAASRMPQLQRLVLVGLGSRAFRSLQHVAMPELGHVQLGADARGARAEVADLAWLGQQARLQELDLRWVKLGEGGAAAVAGLQALVRPWVTVVGWPKVEQGWHGLYF